VDFPLVYSYYSSGRPIYLIVGNEKYAMYWHDRKKSYREIVPDLLAEEEVALTLAKSSLAKFIFGSKMEIVDIRSENTVYYDISATNNWNTNNKEGGVVAIGFLLGAYTIIKLICFFFK
jgi:predicted MPP superfamily phosphohydrolase